MWAGVSGMSVQSASVSTPQHRHVLAPKRYSVITGAETGGRSTTCRRSRVLGIDPANEELQSAQVSGSIQKVWSGLSVNDRDTPGSPCCLPGLRPDRRRDDRAFVTFFVYTESDDGGREDFDESAPSRRSNSAILAVSFSINSAWAAITRACDATRSTSSWYVGSAINILSCNDYRQRPGHADNPR